MTYGAIGSRSTSPDVRRSMHYGPRSGSRWDVFIVGHFPKMPTLSHSERLSAEPEPRGVPSTEATLERFRASGCPYKDVSQIALNTAILQITLPSLPGLMDSPGESHTSNGAESDQNHDTILNPPHPEGGAQTIPESRPSSDRHLDIPDSQSQVLRQSQNSVS